jgi:hypothetical protein
MSYSDQKYNEGYYQALVDATRKATAYLLDARAAIVDALDPDEAEFAVAETKAAEKLLSMLHELGDERMRVRGRVDRDDTRAAPPQEGHC